VCQSGRVLLFIKQSVATIDQNGNSLHISQFRGPRTRGDTREATGADYPGTAGLIPFGLVAGATAIGAGLSILQAVALSVVVFAGASQLAMVPAAVLSALVVPAVPAPEGTFAIAGNTRIPAAVIAALVAWYTASILATIVVGLLAVVALGFVCVVRPPVRRSGQARNYICLTDCGAFKRCGDETGV